MSMNISKSELRAWIEKQRELTLKRMNKSKDFKSAHRSKIRTRMELLDRLEREFVNNPQDDN